ncbi:Mth938-like domain-containing protein [Neisseria perflava]|uniref:Mth938-like domain-containing protein n=1 Tax=Neisseria perflava TaxID=33053 RepID=UPI00209F5F2B|nr:MTH938/NDUFAF3 family protein [Neisseria perflava]MCP1660816.1 uncharacterized protein [Neisseria perflava]MCP1773213.1 uncharacterized protein [Neisseria perflava]
MLIEENQISDGLSVTAYGAEGIEIGGQRYTEPVALRGSRVEKIPQTRPSELTAADLLQTAADSDTENTLPEVIIIGTGATQQFLHPKIAAELAAHGIGLECMNTAAACRTLLLLQGEGRKVWAWLWP